MSSAFPTDPGLPELARAVDPLQMQDLFARHLGFHAPAIAVQGCRVIRIRYRPRMRCVLQYSVDILDTATGRSTSQWVTGTMYAEAGRAERLWREVPAADADAPASRLSLFIRELGMAVNVFPFDRSLPKAGRLLNDRDARLDAEVLRCFGDGTWSITNWKAEPVRYREHLALVVRYIVDAVDSRSGISARRVFFLKAYPDVEQPRRMFEQIRGLAEFARSGLEGIRIDPPVACLDHLNALLLESTPGRPVDVLLRSASEDDVLRAVRATADALARFNLSNAPTGRRYTAADHLSDVSRADRLLACAAPNLRDRLSAVMQTVAAASMDEDVDARPTHRDLKPEHVLWSDAGVGLIDLDSCAAADPVMDAGLMLARFAALRFQSERSRLFDSAAATFRSEYFNKVPDGWRRRFPRHYAAALVEVAAGIFHRQEQDWRQRVDSLVCEAHDVVVRGARPIPRDG